MKRFIRLGAALCLGVTLVGLPVASRADQYDDSQSNPLRVTAYLLNPFGVALEWIVFRPFHRLVSGTKTQEYIFGHQPHPPLVDDSQTRYDYGVAQKAPAPEPTAPKNNTATEPTAEKVVIKEILVEKPITKELTKVVEIERVVLPSIAFNFDKADLTDYGKGMAYLIAQKLKERSDTIIVVEGHTDANGSAEYNLKLGERRAEVVQRELVLLGVDPARMSVSSLGESQPLIPEQTEWARAVNRRVEFKATVR